MLFTEPLTADDLDKLGSLSFRADEPLSVAAELVDAVEQNRLADQADTGYALILAAEITERAGDLSEAERLARRAVAAYRLPSDPSFGYPRAFHAKLLMQLGRDDEAMAEMNALRPLLSQHVDTVFYISEALEAGGRAEIAEQWLTEALATALQRREMLELQQNEDDPTYEQAGTVAFILTRQRHRLRRSLDLPHDALDDLADLLTDAAQGVPGDDELGDDEEDFDGITMLFWPQTEFDRLLQRWPQLAETYGQTWDEHRETLQRLLVQCSEHGHTRLALIAGAVDELADFATHVGGDAADPYICEGYAQQLGEDPRETPWPPGRNAVCWCGSGLKYKKCCVPRARN